MPVLMEAQSIILSINMILSRYEGGWENFKSEIPNDSFCADGKLVRIGFMDPADGMDYLDLLLARGLRRGRANRPADFARRTRVDPRASPARARIESTAFERFSRRRVPASRATARVVPARALDAAEEGIESSPRMNSMKSPTRPSDPAIPPVDLSTSHPPHPIPSHQNLQNRS